MTKLFGKVLLLALVTVIGLALAMQASGGSASPAGDQYGKCKKYPWKCETTTTTTTTTDTPPYVPCIPRNPDGKPGGKDGIPGNDDCAEDPKPEPPPVTTPTTPEPPPTTPTTPEPPITTPEPPVTQPEPPAKVCRPGTHLESDGKCHGNEPKDPNDPGKPPKKPPHPKPPPVCKPGAVELKPCGVEGSG